ncbi:hypothetical protein yc1106_06993 [Curvularia clavata]|uniref:Uncharacterized protein n=1 Tax=Curvularia clavata TaxID=95742 RepID=A0A9Q9DVC7_CURCL|nr:hypothetical protein yc1106_06993 [Curvularia clavata]
MGRQAYLDKIAFGRSAFEPASSTSESAEYIQLESAQSEIPSQYYEATANNYIQLYDERGNPINPRSHQYGKKLRGAQNDVLASVGVVERRRSPAEGLPGSSQERFQILEAEDTMGNAIALVTTLAENICTCFRLGLDVICYPFYYHAALQRLGLVAARPLLPSWRTLIPFAGASPLLPLSLHYNVSNSMADCVRGILTSPAVLLCAHHAMERWVYACVYEAVESSIIRPNKPDTPSRDPNVKDRAMTMLGIRRESPTPIRNSIHKVLSMLGWASPLVAQSNVQKQTITVESTLDPSDGQTIDVGGTRVTNATPLNLPVLQTQDQPASEPTEVDVITIPIGAVEELMRSTTPPASTTGPEDDENDPRIRITSREGIVEMEVRLPPRTLSSHTEIEEAFGSPREGRTSESLRTAHLADEKHSYHRVTQLSCEPAQMISAMVRAQLVGLVMLPARMVILRMIASHYLAGQERHGGPHRLVSSLDVAGELNWAGIGTQLSRVALCGVLEVALDLGLWQLQYLTITKVGKELFGWGTL